MENVWNLSDTFSLIGVISDQSQAFDKLIRSLISLVLLKHIKMFKV